MTPWLPIRTAAWVLTGAGVALSPCLATALPSVQVIRTGGGWLVADGHSRVPLTLTVDGEGPALDRIEVRAPGLSVESPLRLGPRRYRFLLAMPAKEHVEELGLTLSFADGSSHSESFPLVLSPPERRPLGLAVEPSALNVEGLPASAALGTEPLGEGARIDIAVDGARVGALDTRRGQLRARLEVPADLPPDAPSHIQALAVASFPEGYAAETVGLSIVAPVTLQAPVPRGWRLVVQGTESASSEEPPPNAPRGEDGQSVLRGMRVRYGAPIRGFRVRRGRRRELSLPIPTGRVGVGVVAALPGQAFADGGTGPTLAVAIPPDPFGAEPFWPEVAVDGARLVKTLELGPSVRVLVLERPQEAGPIRVDLDGLPAGQILLSPGHGESIRFEPLAPVDGERTAVRIEVRDAQGQLSSHPAPHVFLAGIEVEPTLIEPGVWRGALDASSAAPPSASVDLEARLDPVPVAFGAARAPVGIRGELPVPGVVARGWGGRSESQAGLQWTLGGRAFGGSSFGSTVRGGLGAEIEALFPLLDRRLGLRSGIELGYGRRNGTLEFAGGPVMGSTEIGSLVVPLEVTFSAFRWPMLNLLARAGLALRYEEAQLDVDGQDAGGGGRWAASARLGVEARIPLGPGELVVGTLLDGLFANADGLATPSTRLTGGLDGLRGELGWRAWLDL